MALSQPAVWAIHFDQPLPYAAAQAMQERILAARIANTIPDTVLLLQHTPVVTLGRRGRNQHMLVDENALRNQGIDLVTSTRGGDVTYHGPGQLVLYPIVSVNDLTVGANGYLSMLESLAIRTLDQFGLVGTRREGMAGAWLDQGKVAAIGFRLKRWVSYHGMSLNVDVDLGGFDQIVGCGLVGELVTSMQLVLGETCPSIEAVRSAMTTQFGELVGREVEVFDAGTAPPLLRALLDE